jgi:hypothetical protein
MRARRGTNVVRFSDDDLNVVHAVTIGEMIEQWENA